MAGTPAPERLRVLIACPHALVAEAVRTALVTRGHDALLLRWSGNGPTIPTQRRPAREAPRPGTGLLLSDLDGRPRIAVAASLVERIRVPWVVITTSPLGPGWGAMLAVGASVVLPADIGVDELVELLLAATRHEPLLPAEERRELEDSWHRAQARRADLADRLGRLTPREREILHLLYAGASVARIAETSKVTRATVRSQVKAVLRKLDVKTQLAAVAALDDALDGRDGGVPAPPRVAEAPATC